MSPLDWALPLLALAVAARTFVARIRGAVREDQPNMIPHLHVRETEAISSPSPTSCAAIGGRSCNSGSR